ncbi:MAG: DUF4349 domain-containing protein [Planctomycetota bacterium]
MHTALRWAGLFLAALAAACGSDRFYRVYPAPAKAPSEHAAVSGNFGTVVTLDDVTAGLQDNPSREAAANPIAGAFFDDGMDGALLARMRGEVKDAAAQPAPQPAERMLVHNGEIAVEVARPDESIAAFLAKTGEFGGYLQQQVGTAVTVRLPAARFDEAFMHLRAAGRVLREMRKADDVTEEFLDLGIRIDNARKSRERLLEVLKRAEKVEDVLAVEKELSRLTEELERMEGRQKYLADRVAMATLMASFSAVAEAPPPPRHRREPSRFAWLNVVGAERVMEDF